MVMKIKRMQSRQARDKLTDIMRDAKDDDTVTILTRYNIDHVAVVPVTLLERLLDQEPACAAEQ